MSNEIRRFSNEFERLYCNPAVFASFSRFHPVDFGRVLPFQNQDAVVDDRAVTQAEEAHLAERNDDTRRGVVHAYLKCGLLQEAEAVHLESVIDFFDADFFELMGFVYANVGGFICALRWYREIIAELETRRLNSSSDNENVYASVGYCLYSLGLFAEAISWSKSCIGPRQTADAVCRSLIEYEAQLTGGRILGVERLGSRTRYTVSTSDVPLSSQATPRLKAAMKAIAPFQEIYIGWVGPETPSPAIEPGGYPFGAERDAGSLTRHKMNLIFATCAQADDLVEKGYNLEAKRLLLEAAMVEPGADIVHQRLESLQ